MKLPSLKNTTDGAKFLNMRKEDSVFLAFAMPQFWKLNSIVRKKDHSDFLSALHADITHLNPKI